MKSTHRLLNIEEPGLAYEVPELEMLNHDSGG